MKNKLYYITSFIVPVLILFSILILFNTINGDMSLIISDMYSQYDKLFKSIKENFDFNFLSYSFYKGLGGSMISTFAYYLLSPFNLLLYFFDSIYNFIVITILLKVGVAGLSAYCFFKYNFKECNELNLVFFSSCYALSLYVCAYYFNIMWLDAVAFVPLLLLGIDKLINENKVMLFCSILFLLIVSNYYTAFMVCIFAIIYFLYKLLLNKFDIKKILKFILIAMLTFLSTMFIQLPNILYMFRAERQQMLNDSIINTQIFETISQLFLGTHTTDNLLNQHLFFIYSGLFILVLVFLYFFNNKIVKKEKYLTACVYLILIISIVFVPINNVWHLFSQTNMFNGRYMFLFVLFNIYISIKSFTNIKHVHLKNYFIVLLAIVLLLFITIVLGSITYVMMLINLSLIIIYLIILRNYNKKLNSLLLILVITEIFFSTYLIFRTFEFDYMKSYEGLYENKKEIVDYIKDVDKNKFYRSSFLIYQDINISFEYSFYTASNWFSTNNFNNHTYDNLGLSKVKNGYVHDSVLTTDSILGVKYIVTSDEIPYYEKLKKTEIPTSGFTYDLLSYEYNIYKNEHALSLGFMVHDYFSISENSDFINQNELMKKITGHDENIFNEYEQVSSNYFRVEDDKNIYIDYVITNLNDDELIEYQVLVNGELISTEKSKDNTIFIQNKYSIGETLSFEIKKISGEFKVEEVNFSSIDYASYLKHIDTLTDEQLNVIEMDDGYVRGNINVLEDGVFFTSIPYEKGWNIYVDGKKVEYKKNLDAFISFDLEKGQHEIEMKYYPPGLNVGIIISVISTCLLITYIVYTKKTIKDCN